MSSTYNVFSDHLSFTQSALVQMLMIHCCSCLTAFFIQKLTFAVHTISDLCYTLLLISKMPVKLTFE